MSIRVKNLLREIVATPSVNPAFGASDPSLLGEARMTDFLEAWATSHGWRWLRQEVHHGRDNLVILIPSASAARPITLWEVHQDTVGVEGMTIDPFAGVEKDGRIYGRGACDVKGSMAAMLAALEAAKQEPQRGTILMAFTVNEECGFSGAKALGKIWGLEPSHSPAESNVHGSLSLDELRGLWPDRAIVAEPTEFAVVVSHKGIVRWRCHTRGRAAHSSQPQYGKNAIYDMVDVVTAIRAFDRDVLLQRGLDCLCGRPTVSVNTIHGGTGANVVADHAVIDIDLRLMPGDVPIEAQQELIEFVSQHVTSEAHIEHEPPWNQSRGMQAGGNSAWAEQVARVASFDGRESKLVGVPYGTDAWVFAACGIPTVVVGPGSIAQAHTENEWISMAELERGVEMYRRLATTVS